MRKNKTKRDLISRQEKSVFFFYLFLNLVLILFFFFFFQDGRCDPLARYGTVLFAASELGHDDVLKLLLATRKWNAEYLGKKFYCGSII